MKKIISLVIITVFIAFGTFAHAENVYSDIKENAWYKDSIEYVTESGIMNGIGENQFAPNSSMTRAMFATVLYRYEGSPKVESTSAFTDVESGRWYSDAISWAAKNGIVTGINENEFDPNGNITREQTAAIISRYLESKSLNLIIQRPDDYYYPDEDIVYSDSDSISEYAKSSVCNVSKIYLFVGDENYNFNPENDITRAEAATVIMRLDQRIKQSGYKNHLQFIETDAVSGKKKVYIIELSDDRAEQFERILSYNGWQKLDFTSETAPSQMLTLDGHEYVYHFGLLYGADQRADYNIFINGERQTYQVNSNDISYDILNLIYDVIENDVKELIY